MGHNLHYERYGSRFRIIVTDTEVGRVVFSSVNYSSIEAAMSARKNFNLEKMFNFGETKKPEVSSPIKPFRYYIHYNHVAKNYSILWFTPNKTLDNCYHGYATAAKARNEAQDLLQRRSPYSLEQGSKYESYSIQPDVSLGRWRILWFDKENHVIDTETYFASHSQASEHAFRLWQSSHCELAYLPSQSKPGPLDDFCYAGSESIIRPEPVKIKTFDEQWTDGLKQFVGIES